MDEEINLLDYLKVINKYRGMIISLFFCTVLITMVVTLLMPKIYESTATILPPQESSNAGNLSALLAASGAGGMLSGYLPAGRRSSDVFLAILKSRTMADDVIDKFNLLGVYQAKLKTGARESLKNATQISTVKDGTIIVKVQDKDPQLAAKVANFYVANLDRLTRKLSIGNARESRLFIESRLAETKAALNQAEDVLRAFQAANKVVELSAQAKSAIEAAAALQAKITELEVQLRIMESYATGSNPEVENLKIQIDELKKRLHQMEQGGKYGKELHISFSKAPTLGLELARLTREVKIQESVFSLLTQQHEQAKIAEAKDTPTVQVLDLAVPAEKKCKPKVKLNIAVSGMLSSFIGVFLAFFLEYLKRIKQPPAPE